MRMTRGRAAASLAFALVTLVTAGCGLKENVQPAVYAGAGQPGLAPGSPGTTGGEVLPGSGAGTTGGAGDLPGGGSLPGGASGGGGSATGSSGDLSTSGGSAGGGGGKGRNGGSQGGAGAGGGGSEGGGDAVGDVIRIGVHAPVTGAAAIPQESFAKGVGVYFDYVNRNGGIHGRKVQIFFEDDKFDPTVAHSKCKKMVEQDNVFLLIGAAGSDQIDTCARYAATVDVPYLSAGVHETRGGLGPLGNLDTYFAVTLSYEQQAPLVTRRIATRFGNGKVGLIVATNDSLDSYFGTQKGSIQKAGLDLSYEARIPKDASGAEATTYATAICREGLDAVAWNASPSVLLNVVTQMPCRGVTFFGPGLTNGLNVVTRVGCPQLNGSEFYSPFPGMDVMRKNETFVNAYRQKNGGDEPDDIAASSWGLEKLVGTMLAATGKNLTRERFMATIASVKRFDTGVFPPTNFASRFGGTAMHRLQADCSKREYVTAKLNERP